MKKNQIYAFMAILLLFAAVSYFVKRSPIKKTETNLEQNTNELSQKLSEQLKNFQGLEKSTLSESEKSTTCGATYEKLEIYSMKVLLEDLKNGDLNINTDCFKKDIKKIGILKGFPQTCQLDDLGQFSVTCQMQVLTIRSIRIHRATVNQAPTTLSTDLLINRLMAYLTTLSIETPEDKKNLRELGNELYSRLPHNESAAKAAGIGYVIDDNLSPEDQLKFSELGHEIRNKFSDNWQIYEIDLLSKRNLNREEYDSTIQSTYESNPNSAISNYHMGCKSWSHGNHQEARDYFQKASQINPANKIFAKTLKDSSDPKFERVCQFQISFDPESF